MVLTYNWMVFISILFLIVYHVSKFNTIDSILWILIMHILLFFRTKLVLYIKISILTYVNGRTVRTERYQRTSSQCIQTY